MLVIMGVTAILITAAGIIYQQSPLRMIRRRTDVIRRYSPLLPVQSEWLIKFLIQMIDKIFGIYQIREYAAGNAVFLLRFKCGGSGVSVSRRENRSHLKICYNIISEVLPDYKNQRKGKIHEKIHRAFYLRPYDLAGRRLR